MKTIFVWALLAGCATCVAATPEQGLLFYLSGDKQFTADYAAGGQTEPNYERAVDVLPDGAKGPYFQCADSQLLSYWAPGNIYAQRGTLSFFWRSRYPVGPTEFPIFRVAFADHSSWDMTWLRIDYNGHGFDAFVTDASLSRVRVSFKMDPFPKPDQWTHIAFAWDETRGIRLYVNGKLAARDETVSVLNIGLDQFGPHSRIISPHQVQSAYNFVRGGDIDEIRIYDRMLADEHVAALAKGDAVTTLPSLPPRDLSDARWRDEWYTRYGWNRSGDIPPYYDGANVAVRKVEIHDAYDIKRWWWKATDGIRETTWPGVYNRSILPGRHDYFTLPDWDCYVESGKAITFIMPDEPWNQIEISGAAWGKMDLLKPGVANDGPAESTLFERPKGQERTINHLASAITGRKIRFTNVMQEQPIGELVAYNVTAGKEPAGTQKLTYRLTNTTAIDPALRPIEAFIHGRFPGDERSMLVAQPVENGAAAPRPAPAAAPTPAMPIVHMMIADNWDKIEGGLDGIAIDLPALPVKATHGAFFPLNIQVKDPTWLYRDMLDFTFSVKPGEAKTLWLDLRDRILTPQRNFYLTIAGAGADFNASMLEGAQIRLVFKSRDAAKPEHELDRFTQLRDVYGMMAEEHPRSPGLNLWNRFEADMTDLYRINPDHPLGKFYAAAAGFGQRPQSDLDAVPDGVPGWAYRQVELLGRFKRFVNWYIDNRQSDYGDFGGGMSDDNDLTNIFPGIALMGAEPEKFGDSLWRILDAHYRNGMFTNGLPTIQTDELHTFEEGTNCLGQNLILFYGSPKQLERAMETARNVPRLTGVNATGHRHIKSFYWSSTKIAEEDPWGTSHPNSFLIFMTTELLVMYNGNPTAGKFLGEMADGMAAHGGSSVRFADDAEGGGFGGGGGRGGGGGGGGGGALSYLLETAEAFRGQQKIAGAADDPPPADGAAPADAGAQNAGRGGGGIGGGRGGGRRNRGGGGGGGFGGGGFGGGNGNDKAGLEQSYVSGIQTYDAQEYLYTEGGFWIDRTMGERQSTGGLQQNRLGGVVHLRNDLLPRHIVSWKFAAPATDQSAAFIVSDQSSTGFKVVAYNLEKTPVHVEMTGWNIDPGMWDITQGIDSDNDDAADQAIETHSVSFGQSESINLTLPPRTTTILTLKLKTPGTPYWKRPDIGMDKEDVVVQGSSLKVTVHSVGSVDAPATTIALLDKSGKSIASAAVGALKAPIDLMPKTETVTLTIPAGTQLSGCSVVLDPDSKTLEITRRNNRVGL